MFLLRYGFENYGFVGIECVLKLVGSVLVGYIFLFLVWFFDFLFWNGYLFFIFFLYYFEFFWFIFLCENFVRMGIIYLGSILYFRDKLLSFIS